MTHAAVIGSALVLLLTIGVRASAQTSGGLLLVGVGDAESGEFVVGAQVSIRGLGLTARTDSLSQARIEDVPRGVYTVEARRIGYDPVETRVKFSGRDSVEVVFLMQPRMQGLPAVVVEDSAPSVWLKEFEARRQRNLGGYFITESEIRQSLGGDISDLALAKLPGIRINRYGIPFSTRGVTCQVSVFLDGVRVTDAGAGIVSLELLGGIEYYSPGFVPVQYRSSTVCGALLLWTRP